MMYLIFFAQTERTSADRPPLDEALARKYWPEKIGKQLSFATIKNPKGLRIATYAIKAQNPIGAVIMVHGFRVSARFEFIGPEAPGGPHTQWQGSVLAELLDRGISIYMLDLQGHGQSDGAQGFRAHVEHFDDYARDVLLFAHAIVVPELRRESAARAAQRLFLYGQSLGGAVVVRASQLSKGAIDGWPIHGLVCGAPAVKIPNIPKPALLLLQLLSLLMPTRQGQLKSPPNGIDDAAYKRELNTEPTHYHGNPRLGFLRQLKNACDGFGAPGGGPHSFEQVRATALLAFHSYTDALVNWQGSEALFSRAALPRRKTLVLIRGANGGARPGAARSMVDGSEAAVDKSIWSDEVLNLPLWHNLTREPQGPRLATAIAQWVRSECGA